MLIVIVKHQSCLSFSNNLATLFLEMGKKGQKTKKKNNNGYIYIIRIIINFIYNVCVPVLQKQAPSTVQLHISGSIHSKEIHALKTTATTTKNISDMVINWLTLLRSSTKTVASDMTKIMTN